MWRASWSRSFPSVVSPGRRQKRGHSGAALAQRAFGSAHSRVEDWSPLRAAIVSGKDEEGVLVKFPLAELVHDEPDVLVDIGNHAVEERPVGIVHLVAVGSGILFGDDERGVWGIEGEVGKEGLFATFLLILYPAKSLLGEDVSAVAFRLLEDSVVTNRWVKLIVLRHIAL